jgi:hypothetical protein
LDGAGKSSILRIFSSKTPILFWVSFFIFLCLLCVFDNQFRKNQSRQIEKRRLSMK